MTQAESKEKKYDTVIGLEVHVELATKSKIFCGCRNEFHGKPNTHTCPVCMGMPGSLPVLNKKVVDYAIAVGLALNCTIDRFSQFDRKNYFYPDNPQNYQITQLYHPICKEGTMCITDESHNVKSIGIQEIHMEEDAGKLIHEEGQNSTLIDYNRAGVPLLEIVTKPHFESAFEVIAFLEKLRTTIHYLGVSDCKMQEGSMRVDVNLSLNKKASNGYGTRTEMKNLNSFRAIARAITQEKSRQIALLEQGQEVEMETRRWDDHANVSYSMRSKEEARDYRYFPEPDLPPVYITDAWIDEIRSTLPEMPGEKKERYRAEYGIPDYDIEILTSHRHLCLLFEETVRLCGKPKLVSNWIMGKTLEMLKEQSMDPEDIKFSPQNLARLIVLVEEKTINSTIAKEVFAKMFLENMDPEEYVIETGCGTICEEGILDEKLEEVIKENNKSVQDYLGGKEKALGFLVGQAMKAMSGQADPVIVRRLLVQRLQSYK